MALGTLVSTIDSQIIDTAATTNYGTGVNLYVGQYVDASQIGRSLVKFDLSSLAGATISSGSLVIYDNANDLGSIAGTVSVIRVKRAWTEDGVTWNKYNGSDDWTTAGASDTTSDIEGTAVGTVGVPATESEGDVAIALTAASIQTMVDGGFTNNGYLLKSGENKDMHNFRSSDNAGGTATAPRLIVNYVPATTRYLDLNSKIW